MKNTLLIICSIILVSCGAGGNKRKLNESKIELSKEVKIINLDPDDKRQVNLTDIIDEVRIIPLETTKESFLSRVSKIEIDEDKYFILDNQGNNNLVYVFDMDGQYQRTIGRIGRGPGEFTYPNCLALDKAKKEVVMVENYRELYRFDYDGKFLGSSPIKHFFFDFVLGNSGEILYHTSKRTNFEKDNSTISYNLWIDKTGKNDFDLYFPYEYELFPNGGATFETSRPFSVFGDKIRYFYNFSTIIYDYADGKLSQAYYIDFGDKAPSIDFNKVNHKEATEYIMQKKGKVSFIEGFVESENWLELDYIMDLKGFTVLYDKAKDKVVVDANIVDDLFGTEYINFLTHHDNNIIAVIVPDQINLTAKSKEFFDAPTYELLSNMKNDDNPVLLEISLKLN